MLEGTPSPDQLTRRLDATIALRACELGDIQTIAMLDPRRIGIEAVQGARHTIHIREASMGHRAIGARVMNGL